MSAQNQRMFRWFLASSRVVASGGLETPFMFGGKTVKLHNTEVRRFVVGLLMATFVVVSSSANAETTTVRWGPIELPAATSEGPGQVHNEVAGVSGLGALLIGLFQSIADYPVDKPCSNCYITEIHPNLVYADGTPANIANGVMLHHVVNMNFGKPDITCRPGFSGTINLLGLAAGGNERFYAAGNERTIAEIKPGYGYRVSSSDDWGLVYHLMNMNSSSRTVYFEYTFEWQSSGVSKTRPMWLDIDQCEDSEVDVPAGYSDTHWDWKADRSGRIATIGGHVHNYGISIAYENLSRNENIFTSVAGYAAGSPFVPVGPGSGADVAHPTGYNTVTSDPLGLANYNGHIADMTRGDPWSRIKKGNNTRLNTQINRPDATDHDMGIMVAFMKEDFCITNFWCF